jgi:hypothetical protein
MFLRVCSILALLLAALSLGPSFAHLLEAPPRLTVWPPRLWIDATVVHGQFTWFRFVGAPLDVSAIVVTSLLAFLLRGESGAGWVLAGAAFLALALGAWFAIVAPANDILATWGPGLVPADFESVRNRWEYGHMGVAVLKAMALVALAIGLSCPSGTARSVVAIDWR